LSPSVDEEDGDATLHDALQEIGDALDHLWPQPLVGAR
jgi:hypothetical protein